MKFKMSKIYLGIDPSSKTIGFTVFQDNNGIIPLEVNCFQPLQEDLLDDLLFIGDNVFSERPIIRNYPHLSYSPPTSKN